ncbi:uridine kinase [Clostridium sp. C2-6-12]|uniref:uridine kinase family protein n=1 Tax=Clostridium sp. C2-6-12 TaxID=2698832 RepID=UPI001371C939|nr:uridine kinase [Clostridium sp. C2-6-12]
MNKEKIKLINDDYGPVLKIIECLYKEKKELLIAIDGRCGGGKSTLGKIIQESFNCNIFHMDDFFLPLEMRTTERLTEAGGNVHYERFKEEVLIPLKNQEQVIYKRYLCKNWAFDQPIKFERKSLNIVEGSYSLHPTLRGYYDYKIFIDVAENVQHERILKRNGKEKFQDFLNKWIPMEEYYFKELSIKSHCDLIVETGSINK